MEDKNNFIVVTSVVILNNEGKILLGKRSAYEDVFPNMWSIPGGKVDRENKVYHEGFIETNAIREVKEEIGIDIKIDSYVQSHYNGNRKIYVIYKGHIISGEPKALEDTAEVKWFTFKEIDPETLCPEVYDILKKVVRK